MEWLALAAIACILALRYARGQRNRASVAAVRMRLLEAVRTWRPWTRRAWCRKQRHLLNAPGRSVVWVRGGALPWAEWGARRGYFEVQFMDGLPYLRLLGAPAG